MSPCRSDRGSATVEFALVVPLLIGLVLAVCQAGAWVLAVTHAHDVAGAAARWGARNQGAHPAVTAREMVRRDLAGRGSADARIDSVAGRAVVIVEVRIPLDVGSWRTPVTAEVCELALVEPG